MSSPLGGVVDRAAFAMAADMIPGSLDILSALSMLANCPRGTLANNSSAIVYVV